MPFDISVIVPVYNAQATLAQCLGNLVFQTKDRIQIILIDDASTDETLRICRDCRQQFGERIMIFQQEQNAGPGAARNRGLEAAEGAYIGFVDADDIVDVTMYEKLYAAAKKTGADITDCAFFREFRKEASIHFSKDLCGELDAEKKSILISAGGFIVTKLFKRSLFEDTALRFREAYGLEDMDFLIKAIALSSSAASCEEILYRYRDSEGSLSKEMRLETYAGNHLEAMRGIYDQLSGMAEYSEIQEAAEYAMFGLYGNVVNQTIAEKKSDTDVRCLQILRRARQLRLECAKGSPGKNRFFRKHYTPEEIFILELNDKDPKKALAIGKRKEKGTV